MGSLKVKLWGQISQIATGKHVGLRKSRNFTHDSACSPAMWRGGKKGLFLYGKMIDEQLERDLERGVWLHGQSIRKALRGVLEFSAVVVPEAGGFDHIKLIKRSENLDIHTALEFQHRTEDFHD